MRFETAELERRARTNDAAPASGSWFFDVEPNRLPKLNLLALLYLVVIYCFVEGGVPATLNPSPPMPGLIISTGGFWGAPKSKKVGAGNWGG